MHRLLRQEGENGERRPQRPAQHHAIPRLLAFSPNEVWTWDITKLPLIRRGIYLSLYVVLDLYSRFVVAWRLSIKENSALSRQLMNEATTRDGITEGQLTVHQDRGSPMTAHGYLENMKELDITCSHSRPRVSNDNPFSESQFKTQKQQALDERFVKGRPCVKLPPQFVAINPIALEAGADSAVSDPVNFPTLTAAGEAAGNRD